MTQLAVQEIKNLSDEERGQLEDLIASSGYALWAPNPGPQSLAYYSEADELFYGGAAGGGKSGLIIGLALTRHQRTLVIRKESTQLRGFIDDVARVIGSRDGLNRQDGQWRIPPKLTGVEDHLLEFGGVPNPGDEERHQGIPHDLLAFDEVTQIAEYILDYLSTWNRSINPKQRCRIILAANPPTPSTMRGGASNGIWIIRRYAPWLDPLYRDPLGKGRAEPGELRWFVTIDGNEEEWPNGIPFAHYPRGHPDPEYFEIIKPRSRTFVPAMVTDNPYLAGTDYVATLQKLPEPLRSALLYGDFSVSLSDKPTQLFPTEWVREAMIYWESLNKTFPHPTAAPNEMTAIGVDVSRGGGDATIMAPRHHFFYDTLKEIPSVQTLNGASVAARVIEAHRGQAVAVIDANGVGASAYDHLRNTTALHSQGLLKGYVGSEKAWLRDRSGRYEFLNLRSQSYWKLREQLDPTSPERIALPPDDKLLEELTVHTWVEQGGKIHVLRKEDVTKLLGRSPDRADSVVMASTVRDDRAPTVRDNIAARAARVADADINQQGRRRGPSREAIEASWSDNVLPYPRRR